MNMGECDGPLVLEKVTLVFMGASDVRPVLLHVHNVGIVVGKVGDPFALVVKTAVKDFF